MNDIPCYHPDIPSFDHPYSNGPENETEGGVFVISSLLGSLISNSDAANMRAILNLSGSYILDRASVES
jgi:hypothetical protein